MHSEQTGSFIHWKLPVRTGFHVKPGKSGVSLEEKVKFTAGDWTRKERFTRRFISASFVHVLASGFSARREWEHLSGT